MFRIIIHTGFVIFLTLLTQIGGIAWIASRFAKLPLLAFLIVYGGLWHAATWSAPYFGRVAISCTEKGTLQVQSWIYCALNRNYVSLKLEKVLFSTANELNQLHPGTITLLLDANFPFFDGFPLLPHLSHDDGDKADTAFYYSDENGYLPGKTRSPIGYFAFEQGPTNCQSRFATLRWDLKFLQPLWSNYTIDEKRLRDVLLLLAENDDVGKIFVEPHLVDRLGVSNEKIRFQGCRAARHDDHIHFQL